ncbi:hypothetical protein BYT27DRAFT_7207604 [Phlegmacium glaucopus]|nr:hypothetical protein BYT27DRAFT_7207604 [Phlegmacium glaucopus]
MTQGGVTKKLLSTKGPMTSLTLPKSEMKRVEAKMYVKLVVQDTVKDPASFKEYSKGKGIISTREKFLEFLKNGAGWKTLAHIFEFGHTQSDDIHAKKPASIFIKKIVDFLHRHDVTFINSTQELTPSEVDNVIEIGEPLEDALRRAVGCGEGLCSCCEKLDDPKEKKKLDARYYGLLDLPEQLDAILVDENKDFWTKLITDSRVTKRPHFTTVHRGSIDEERELWDRCAALHWMTTTTPTLFKGKLSHMVWDKRVMTITGEDSVLEVPPGGDDGEEGQEDHGVCIGVAV